MNREDIQNLIEYFRTQGAPGDQQMLILLMREVQQAEGGVLSLGALEMIRASYALQASVLQALIRRIPALRCETVPHRLEICGNCRVGADLRAYIEEKYGVKSGGENKQAGFSYRVTGCMKNCRKGPSIRWDSTLYPQADAELLERLIHHSPDQG